MLAGERIAAQTWKADADAPACLPECHPHLHTHNKQATTARQHLYSTRNVLINCALNVIFQSTHTPSFCAVSTLPHSLHPSTHLCTWLMCSQVKHTHCMYNTGLLSQQQHIVFCTAHDAHGNFPLSSHVGSAWPAALQLVQHRQRRGVAIARHQHAHGHHVNAAQHACH